VPAIECLHYADEFADKRRDHRVDSMPIPGQALNVARTFRPMDQASVQALLTKTAQAALRGQYELYKTSHHFDGTYPNPQWLG
jgi:hypothetical protein